MSDIPRDPRAPIEGVELGPIEDTEDVVDTEIVAEEPEGAIDAEIETDADGNPVEVEEEVIPARGGGGAATPRNLRARAQQAERERDELRQQQAQDRARLQALEQRVLNDPGAAARAAAEERDRIAVMTPDEVSRYYYEKGTREFGGAIQALQMQTQELLDKQAYDAASRSSPLHQRYRSQVEQVLAFERAQGRSTTREVILDYLIGKDVRERSSVVAPKQRVAAAQRVAAVQARPTGGRGDVAAARRLVPGSAAADDAAIDAARRAGRSPWDS